MGSNVHGLSNPGTDDRDEMGVCIEPREYVTGLRSFEHWVFRTQPEGVPSGPGDLDLTVYGLRKFCRLALKGSPTVLLLLFIDGEDVLMRAPLGAELQALAPAFVSARAGRAFLGTSTPSVAVWSASGTPPGRERCRASMATTPSTQCTHSASHIRASNC